MKSISAFVEKYPVRTYYAIAFLVSWGGMLLVIGPAAFFGAAPANEAAMPLMFLAMFGGPTVAGLVMTGLVHGRAGFRELRSRLFTWRVGARWYAVALLTAPLLILAVLLALSTLSAGFLPGVFTSGDKATILLTGIIAGMATGFFEELGWTGFATPALRRHYGILATGLIMGLLWGAWHFPLFSSGDPSGALPSALYLPVQLFTFLVAFRVLLVWLYDRTGSLLLAMLMHATLTGSTLILQPVNATGALGVAYNLVLTAVLCAVVAVAAAVNHGHLSHEPLPGHLA